MQILRAHQSSTHGKDDFQIRRVRPGAISGPDADPALGPLAAFDHGTLKTGKVVKMHEHQNDEILSYMWRGIVVHEDSAGHRIPISANNLMMMNAGESFWHEEAAIEGPVEALQIFVRPREVDLPALVAFHARPDGTPEGQWGWIAGPEESGAPLIFRNKVHLYDVRLHNGSEIEVPIIEGLTPFLYVMDGIVEIDGERLGKGDAVSDAEQALPLVRALGDASLVLFLVDRTATGSKAGTISGH